MKIQRVYLITWLQRTTLHLQEMHDFFRGRFEFLFLDPNKLKKLQSDLAIDDVELREQNDFDTLRLRSKNIVFTATEDGLYELSLAVDEFDDSRVRLETYYKEKLGPALSYLFSRGAPLPKELSDLQEVYPIVLVVKNANDADIELLRTQLNEEWDTRAESKTTQIYFGHTYCILRFVKPDHTRDLVQDELLGNIIFFREYYRQLRHYLNIHRTMWDRISAIREDRNIRYREFPQVRRDIMGFLKTLLFVKARLSQMGDIAESRLGLITPDVRQELLELGMLRFESAVADKHYIMDLWNMTIDYTDGTLKMFESLFEQNTQRELNALKFITLIGALTGFFGMNISFPWDQSWSMLFPSSFAVVLTLIFVSASFYFGMRQLIYNRHFVIKEKEQPLSVSPTRREA